MQDAEYNGHIGHYNKAYKGNGKRRACDFCPSEQIASTQPAGDSADKDKCSGKKEAHRLKKVKKLNAEFVAVHISVGVEAVEKHHTEYAEAADFVNGVYSFSVGQYITLFQKILLKLISKYITIYNITIKEVLQDLH